MSKRVVTFGEIMMRLSTPDHLRFAQATVFEVQYAGGEANVSASLARYGVPTDFVTRLPENDLGDACIAYLRKHGIGVDKILRGGDRLGVYFLEHGAMQRGSKVIYDRAGSAIATIEPEMIDWESVFADADWFHFTGITPAVSESLCRTCLDGVVKAKEMGLTVSVDLNYRSKLWKWGQAASEVMPDFVQHADIVIGNEEDADKVLGIAAPGVDVEAGKVDAEAYRSVCEQIVTRFPGVDMVAITLRGSISASHNTWSGVLYRGGTMHQAPVFDLTHIVDRVGGGDSFVGGLIYGLRTYGGEVEKALKFAVAASCLKHSIYGDFNQVSVADVEAIMEGVGSGRVQR